MSFFTEFFENWSVGWNEFVGSVSDKVSDVFNNIGDFVSDIFGGHIFKFISNLGDKAFGFFTPNGINDFDFSKLILFIFGVAILGIIIKFVGLFH